MPQIQPECPLQPFPDVTFCNYNPYKWSVVSTNPDFDDIKVGFEDFEESF